jgi:hypothetical protein
MKFASKRDSWVTLMLAAVAMSMMVISCGYMFRDEGRLALVAIPLLGSTLLIIWVLHRTEYELGPVALVIHCGPLRWSIPADSIYEVYPTRDPISAPALSLERLRINYVIDHRRCSVLISPDDKHAFLATLTAVTPELRLVGERAVHALHSTSDPHLPLIGV